MGPRHRALGSLKSLRCWWCLWRPLRDDFVGLIPACSHAHGPEHPRHREKGLCPAQCQEGGAGRVLAYHG